MAGIIRRGAKQFLAGEGFAASGMNVQAQATSRWPLKLLFGFLSTLFPIPIINFPGMIIFILTYLVPLIVMGLHTYKDEEEPWKKAAKMALIPYFTLGLILNIISAFVMGSFLEAYLGV